VDSVESGGQYDVSDESSVMSLTVNGSDRPLPLTPSQPAVNQCDHLPPPAVNHLSAADEHLHVRAVSESAGGLAVAVGGLQCACECAGALPSAQSHLTHRLIDTDPAHTCPAAAAADSDDDDAVYCDAAADDVTCWSRDAATPPPAELAGRLRALWLGGWSWRQSCGWCVLLLVSSLLMALLLVVGLLVVASYLLLESDADLALVHAARSLPQLCLFYRDRYAPWRDRYLAARGVARSLCSATPTWPTSGRACDLPTSRTPLSDSQTSTKRNDNTPTLTMGMKMMMMMTMMVMMVM